VAPAGVGAAGTGRSGATAPVLVCLSLGGAWLLPEGVFAILLGYHAGALAYTFALKRAAVLDVVALASMYGLRVFAGGAAVQIWPSPWLIAFALFLFLSLALLKRVVELPDAGEAAPGRGFGADDRTFCLCWA
jgi:4-hydroxybenzoate polyprenyltransferase